MEFNNIPIQDAWDLIQDSDCLLWRDGWLSRIGRGLHYHASKLAHWDNNIVVMDTHWRQGGDIRLLTSDVKMYSPAKNPKLDWFVVNPYNLPYDRQGAIRYMRQYLHVTYGFRNLFHASLFHVLGLRLFKAPEIEDDEKRLTTRTPFCSALCVRADKYGGGHNPVPFLASDVVEPCDLARSDFYRYRATLTWDENSDEWLHNRFAELVTNLTASHAVRSDVEYPSLAV